MKNTTKTNSLPNRALMYSVMGLGHLLASTLTTIAIVCLVIHPKQAYYVLMLNLKVEELRALGWSDGLMLWGLGACVWALMFITYRLFEARRQQAKAKTLRLSRGTIMTETVIILPVYFMLSFGLSQLSLNFIAGSLANVAGYMASRSYWVWEGEVNKNRSGTNVSQADALERAKISGALVMAAVAPGDFTGFSLGGLNGSAQKARAMTAPLGFDSGQLAQIFNAATGGFSMGEGSFYKSFDPSSGLVRGALKFTHAYNASTVEVLPNGAGVKFTYQMLQSMPAVGKFFGSFKVSGPNGLMGYYWLSIMRDYTFTKQLYSARAEMPDGSYSGGPSGDGSVSQGTIRDRSGTSGADF